MSNDRYVAMVSTRYYGPTNSKGARIRAIVHNVDAGEPGRALWRPFDYAATSTNGHRDTAIAAISTWRDQRATYGPFDPEPTCYASSEDGRGYTFVFDRQE